MRWEESWQYKLTGHEKIILAMRVATTKNEVPANDAHLKMEQKFFLTHLSLENQCVHLSNVFLPNMY